MNARHVGLLALAQLVHLGCPPGNQDPDAVLSQDANAHDVREHDASASDTFTSDTSATSDAGLDTGDVVGLSALSDRFADYENTTLSIHVAQLLLNDSGREGDALAVSSVGGATHGVVSRSGSMITFVPEADFLGNAGFDYILTDGTHSSSAHVDIDVRISSESVMTWSASGVAGPLEWRQLDYDIDILGLVLDQEFGPGGFGIIDQCIATYRDVAPLAPARSGGNTELFCLNPYFPTPGHWHQDVDWTSTPMYLPANTHVVINSSAGGVDEHGVPISNIQGPRTGSFRYRRHLPGTPRHRMLRIPHLDAAFPPGAGFIASYYRGTPERPLHVRGYLLYDGMIGDYDVCVQRLNGMNGALIEQTCLPTRQKGPRAPDGHFENIGTDGMIPLDWVIPWDQLVSASCAVSNLAEGATLWDCAIYLIVEIPPDTVEGPENIFRDYGNTAPTLVESWCHSFIDTLPGLSAPIILDSQRLQLCDYDNPPHTLCTMTPSEQISQCEDVYRAATCMATGTCFLE